METSLHLEQLNLNNKLVDSINSEASIISSVSSIFTEYMNLESIFVCNNLKSNQEEARTEFEDSSLIKNSIIGNARFAMAA